MIITLTLNPSIDYIMQVDQLQMEDTLRAKYAFFQAGGKGINVSRVLTRLGVSNTAWGFCGGDTGNWLRHYLDEEHVPHAFVSTHAETRINTIVTEMSTGKQLRISASGEAAHHHEVMALQKQFEALESSVTDWVALGGSMAKGMVVEDFRRLMAVVKQKRIPCVLDADGEVLKAGLEEQPYLIKPNQYELERLLGTSLSSMEQVIQGARFLIHQNKVQVVVTSLAEAGALLVSANQVLRAKAPQVAVKSKVGAGDSMVAGLIKGLDENKSLAEVLRMGIAAGTAAVMTPGTELCYVHDYEALLPQVEVTPV